MKQLQYVNMMVTPPYNKLDKLQHLGLEISLSHEVYLQWNASASNKQYKCNASVTFAFPPSDCEVTAWGTPRNLEDKVLCQQLRRISPMRSAKTFKFCPNRKRYILWNHCKRWIHGNNKEPAVKKEILIIASIRSPTAPQPRKWTRRSSTSEEIWGHQSLTGTPHKTATVEAARGFQHVLPVWQFRS